MKLPKMIIFDYGHTLLYEPGWDSARGNVALLKYATKNENGYTFKDVQKGADLIFGQHIESVRKLGYDIPGQVGDRLLYESFGIEFSLTPHEMENVFWNAASMGEIMPDADKLIDYINGKGIRSAIISNLLWSGEALTERLNRLLPNNQFEFVMTSSDYLFRKPNRMLFEVALRKAELDATDVWYCGDNPETDVEGTASNYAKRIYEVIEGNDPLPVHTLKQLAGFSSEDKSKFDRALTELQTGMFITMCGRQQKRSKLGEEYGWSSTVFCTTEMFFGEEVFEKAKGLDMQEAVDKITAQVYKLNPNAEGKKIVKFIRG